MRPRDFVEIGNDKYIYIIAEIGINHNGSLEIAKQLIDIAKEIGCDAVKFQKRTINLVYSKEILDQPRESPWGKTQRQQKEGLEFSIKQYDEINSYCIKKDIDWFASSWDIESQKLMRKYNFPFNKVASAMSVNKSFVKIVAEERKPTFVSTGMTEIKDIDLIVEIFKKNKCPLMLMHTVSTYPSTIENLNLKCINSLRERYEIPIGYSGHEVSVAPSIMAATMGAGAIERHITLDRSMYGSDQAASLEPVGFRKLNAVLRSIPDILGSGKKTILKEEELIASKLRYWIKQ